VHLLGADHERELPWEELLGWLPPTVHALTLVLIGASDSSPSGRPPRAQLMTRVTPRSTDKHPPHDRWSRAALRDLRSLDPAAARRRGHAISEGWRRRRRGVDAVAAAVDAGGQR
jgi:hypothetical protein